MSFAINKQDMDEVIAVCMPAVEYLPDALEFYYYWGIAHYQKEEKEEALEVFKKGVQQVTPESDKAMVSDFYSIMGDLYHLKKMNAANARTMTSDVIPMSFPFMTFVL